MQYDQYLAEDFAADESFIAYYIKKDSEAVVFWEEWIDAHPEKNAEIAAAIQLLNLVSVKLPQSELAAERQRMRRYIAQSDIKTIPLSRNRNYIAAAAASVLIAVGVASAYFFSSTESSSTQQTATEWVQQVNPNGKKARLKLSDGTIIVLNGGSVLHYPKSFAKNKREIRLQGEAYFSVSHDSLRPFTVQTGPLQTTVLGTEFNVSAYEAEALVRVSLLKGKVKVNNASGQTVLSPGQQAVYNHSEKSLQTLTFNTENETAWKDGKLVFRDASFSVISKAVERAYGYKLVDRTSNESWHYTGSFQKEDVLTVVENICFSKHLSYTVSGETIYISSKK